MLWGGITTDVPKRLPAGACPRCWKQEELCFCEGLVARKARLAMLVLQHPREIKDPRGTARLLTLQLENAVHRVGLSWPSFAAALGRKIEPTGWAVLYAGPKKAAGRPGDRPLKILTRDERPYPLRDLQGVVIVDGTWKQAKTLLFRNPWLKRLPRAVLTPPAKSMYGDVRREPRETSISTLEAAALTLDAVGEPPATGEALRDSMRTLLARLA